MIPAAPLWFGADDGHMCAPAVGDSLSKEEEEVLKTVMLSASAVLIPDDGSTRARARGGEAARIITVRSVLAAHSLCCAHVVHAVLHL